ncbi:MAG: nucleotide exchange factor GrpE [Rhodothermales bacterium]|nr:nucleotide exchange factor GrpE [Rhodothermales bacterium]
MVEKEVLDNDQTASAEVGASDSASNPGDGIPDVDQQSTDDDENAGSDQEADLQAKVIGLNEKVLRQAAEFQNYRRRMEKANVESVSLGKSIVIQRLLDVLDDLERSIDAADSDTEDGAQNSALRDGVKLVFQKFQDELSRLGVEPIPAVGAHFNEDEHEAMMQQPAPDGIEPGTVLQELQRGYRMGDRILRHSKVIVAS